MNTSMINLSTGPVGITREVQHAFQEPPISHRSMAFKRMYGQTTDFLSDCFQVRHTFLLTGSGTLANEAMLQEVKQLNGPGLVLCNGEFGYRLSDQARRNGLEFYTYALDWGSPFDLAHIRSMLVEHAIQWMLFCHCETSTGMVNPLKKLCDLANVHRCLCFVDCMSTAGTQPFNLSGVAMATASSGKGLGSLPGLAVVFSNIDPVQKANAPACLDLFQYQASGGIPYTLSSNLVRALQVAVSQKWEEGQFGLIREYRSRFYTILNYAGLVPFSNPETSVFTIVPHGGTFGHFIAGARQKLLILSCESDYLKRRSWCQLATFGYYQQEQLDRVCQCLRESIGGSRQPLESGLCL